MEKSRLIINRVYLKLKYLLFLILYLFIFEIFLDFFWIAPEHIDILDYPDFLKISGKSPEGDIYSLGIILKEIFTRTSPFEEYDEMNESEIVQNIISDNLRPQLDELQSNVIPSSQISSLIEQTWQTDIQKRPTSSFLLKTLALINPHHSKNVVDNMAKMLEKHSEQLEKNVAEKFEQIEAEKKRSLELLNRMLPE